MSNAIFLERLRRRVQGSPSDALLSDLVADAEAFILSYTGLDTLPRALEGALTQIACMYYNRVGAEGEDRIQEGTVTIAVDALPADLRALLRAHRVGKTVSL